jgi:ATP-dependent Clp protease ATP-binding subunit ClpC
MTRYLTDSWDGQIDFKNTIIIMTSKCREPDNKDFSQGVGFGTAAKVAQADSNSKKHYRKCIKENIAPRFLDPTM